MMFFVASFKIDKVNLFMVVNALVLLTTYKSCCFTIVIFVLYSFTSWIKGDNVLDNTSFVFLAVYMMRTPKKHTCVWRFLIGWQHVIHVKYWRFIVSFEYLYAMINQALYFSTQYFLLNIETLVVYKCCEKSVENNEYYKNKCNQTFVHVFSWII